MITHAQHLFYEHML